MTAAMQSWSDSPSAAAAPAGLATRAYRYAVRLDVHEARAVKNVSRAARRAWNQLVWFTRDAVRRAENGTEATLHREYAQILTRKKVVGRACCEPSSALYSPEEWARHEADIAAAKGKAKATVRKDIATETDRRRGERDAQERVLLAAMTADQRRKWPSDRAARNAALAAQKRTAKTAKLRPGNVLWIERRRLAVEYAIDRSAVRYGQPGDTLRALPSACYHALSAKYRDAADLWCSGQRGEPHFKSTLRGDPVTLQAQRAVVPVDGRIDLSAIHPALGRVKVVQHRPIPANGQVKQVALSVSRTRCYVVLFVEAPVSTWAVDLPTTGRVIGVDPGLKTPVTWATADGSLSGKLAPPNTRRTAAFLRRQARLQRQLDRQRRTANPDCYDADGRAIRGRHPHVFSNRMRDTLHRLAILQERLANRRTESYRLGARSLLGIADDIRIGTWRPARQAAGDHTAQIRGALRSGLDAAISTAVNILTDYAKRSTRPKTITPVPERMTTRTCPDCAADAGPAGDLSVREWTCAHCGAHHDRDTASARNLANLNFQPPTKRPETAPAHGVDRTDARSGGQTKVSRKARSPRRPSITPVSAPASADVVSQPPVASREDAGGCSGGSKALPDVSVVALATPGDGGCSQHDGHVTATEPSARPAVAASASGDG